MQNSRYRSVPAQLPLSTLSILSLTGLFTSLQFVFPHLLSALERTPAALTKHEWWRLITPLFVHSDGWRQIAFDFPAILILGVLVEAMFGAGRLLALYLICGFVGEVAGFAWQPSGAGASVAGAGLLGALAFRLLGTSVQGKVGGVLLLIGAAILSFERDIHGPPLLAGALLACAMSRLFARTP